MTLLGQWARLPSTRPASTYVRVMGMCMTWMCILRPVYRALCLVWYADQLLSSSDARAGPSRILFPKDTHFFRLCGLPMCFLCRQPSFDSEFE
eukprot:6181086-Pleurochrysis_carterae.AAC.3